MRAIFGFCFVLAALSASFAFAKRSPPAEVAPVKAGDVTYRVEHDQMGCVEAWDTAQNEMLWRRQIYVVKYVAGLERDVQDVFITSIELKDKTLTVTNERESVYELDLRSLEVKVVKGSLVEGK